MNHPTTTLILILGSIIAIGPMTIDMYLPAFSAIAQSFSVEESAVQLSLTSYFIGMALSQLVYGPMIDRFGRKPPLLFGLVVYIIASIFCCFARNIDDLIILRFFQALGVCACMTVPRAIVRDLFTPQEGAKVFSYLILVMGLAPIFAPFLGSVILENFGWKAIFVASALFGIAALLMTIFILPKAKEANKDDKISSALKKYIGILKDRNFVICSISGGCAMGVIFCYVTGSPFLYLEYFHLSPQNYSLIFAINSIGFISFSQINARLLRKFPMENILKIVTRFFSAIAFALIFSAYFFPNLIIITILTISLIGVIGMINPNTTALAMANQAKHAGSASALLGTLQFIIATIASLAINYFHSESIFPFLAVMGVCAICSALVFSRIGKRLEDLK